MNYVNILRVMRTLCKKHRYNFTMNEDEPMEREVAIDPEMLGNC